MEITPRENYDNPALSTGLTISDIFADYQAKVMSNRKQVLLNATRAADFRQSVYSQLTEYGNANAEASRKAFEEASQFAKKEIERAYNSGVSRVDENVKKYARQGYNAKIRADNQSKAMMISLASTLGSLAGALAVSRQSANQQLLQITSLVNTDAPDMLHEIDQKQRIFLQKGLAGTVNKNGIATEVSAVGELQMRQDSQKTLLQAQGDRSAEYGLYLIQVSAHPSSCPLCLPWQAKVLVDDVYNDGKADGEHELLSTAMSAGLFHYNCRHSYIVYIPGYSRDNIFDYDKASKKLTAERYAIEQEQRYNERMIREWKRVEQGAMSERDVQNARKKIVEWQARQRALQREAEEKRIPFYRQYQRETIGGETKPTKLVYIEHSKHRGQGTPIGVAFGAPLSKRQKAIDDKLQEFNSSIEVPKKAVSMTDLATLTRYNKVEYSLFTKGQTRLIIKGDNEHVEITPDIAEKMAKEGWKWSGHTHPGDAGIDVVASDSDKIILKAFGQKRSVIYNANGQHDIFGV